jgi:serine/threonine-protein kinase RsbW
MSHAPRSGPLSDRRLLVEEQFDRSSVTAMRTKVAAAAAGEGLRDLPLTRLTVAVHEIVLNAVRHGGGRGGLRLWRTGNVLQCLVSDDGPGIPERYRALRPHRSGIDVGTGRHGLWLAGQLCPGVEIADRAEGGTDVRLEFPLPDDHAPPP